MEQVLGYVEETVSEVKKQNLSKYENKEKNNHDSICSCPLCGGDILKYKWGYGGSNYKNGLRKNPSPFIYSRGMPINTGVSRLNGKY